MLTVGTKKTDSSKIFKNCEKYIRKNYDKATVEKIKPYLTEGDTFRDHIVSTLNVAYESINQSISATATYYRFIKSIENRIPITSTELKFTWYDSVTKKKFPVLTYKLEKICLLYNLASFYSRIGGEIKLSAPEAHKTSLNSFQYAMGCLNEIRNQGFESRIENNIDLTPENLSMLIFIQTAQCYYIMFDRLDKNTANKNNLAKLCYTIHKNYDQAYLACISFKLSRAYPEESKFLLKYQSFLYLALSNYWISFPEREEGSKLGIGFGKGVLRLKLAHENIVKAMQIKGIHGRILEIGKEYLAKITKEKELAEGENLSIYMDGIPDVKALSNIEELVMVQPKFPPPVDIDSAVLGQENLLCLVPKEVMTFAAEYKDLLLQMTSAESSKVSVLISEISAALGSMGLPQKINALSSETGLPEAI